MNDRLFDPTPFSKRGVQARDERSPRAPRPTPMTVTIGERWRIIERKNRVEVHAYKGPWMKEGSIETQCGAIGIPLSVEPRVPAEACPACLKAMGITNPSAA